MTIRTAAQCLEEALRCVRDAVDCEDRAEMQRLLGLAAAWLEVAKHRAAQDRDQEREAVGRSDN